MNIFVITTKNAIYATYYKTIFFKGCFTDSQTKEQQTNAAKSIAFDYADCGCKVNCERVELEIEATDNDIFDFLESRS